LKHNDSFLKLNKSTRDTCGNLLYRRALLNAKICGWYNDSKDRNFRMLERILRRSRQDKSGKELLEDGTNWEGENETDVAK